ncbi:MAG: hypothetical protein JW809_11935 [Pirellulales bacterium]|nr:hypothetical protein [Pirellulales bacterium]
MKRSTIAATVILWGLLGMSDALAQGPVGSYHHRPYSPYQPSRPTMSPWFGLYNTNRGPLPNYYNYVVPRQQLERTLRQQEDAIRQQNVEYQSLQRDVSRFERAAAARPTGASSRFFEYRDRFQNQRLFFGTR